MWCNNFNFRFDTVENQNIVNLSSYRSKSYANVVLGDSKVIFLREGGVQIFVYISIVYCLYMALQNRKKSSNFLVFHHLVDFC